MYLVSGLLVRMSQVKITAAVIVRVRVIVKVLVIVVALRITSYES